MSALLGAPPRTAVSPAPVPRAVAQLERSAAYHAVSPPARPVPRVAVVGAGAAGALTALHLLRVASARRVALRVELFDRGPTGQGVAYRTGDPQHLLNVPAVRMSAHPDDPAHFVRWLRAAGAGRADRGGADSGTLLWRYAPRECYARYLAECLAEQVVRAGPGELRRRHDDVLAVRRGRAAGGGHVELELGSGERCEADAVVLATGVAPPRADAVPVALDDSPRYVADPWARGALSAVRAADRHEQEPAGVLLVGTGLTAVDVALTLGAAGHRVLAVSRSGLLPRAHRPGPAPRIDPPALLVDEPGVHEPGAEKLGLDALRRVVHAHLRRSVVELGDWRPGFDGLRPVTASWWSRLPATDRAEFLRRDARRWDVHRHRMAPATAAALARLRAAHQLLVRRALLVSARPGQVSGRPTIDASLSDGRRVRVGWVVNCSGPDTDVTRTANPLLAQLVRTGQARPDPLRLGLDVASDGALLDGHGQEDRRLRAVGALRRGQLWESTAVPELRQQAADVARDLVDLLTPTATTSTASAPTASIPTTSIPTTSAGRGVGRAR